MKSNEEMFAEWLSERVSSSRLSDYYMAIPEVESFARKKKIIVGSLFSVTDSFIIGKIVNALNNDRFFRTMHKRQMKNIVEVMQYYHKYMKENEEKLREQEITAPDGAASSEDHVVDFSKRDESYAYTKPVSISYFGETFDVTSWRGAYIKVCELLFADYPNIFSTLSMKSELAAGKALIYSEITVRKLRDPAKIADEYYVETNQSAYNLVKDIGTLLDICRVDYENVEIRYIKKTAKEAAKDTDSVRTAGWMNAKISQSVHPGRTEFESWLQESNTPAGSIKTYADGVDHIGKYLTTNGLESRSIFSIRGVARLERIRAMLYSDRDFAQSCSDGSSSLKLYALKKYIAFRSNGTAGTLDGETVQQFSAVLRDNFENGFRPNSLIDRNRFRQFFADIYGAPPSQDDGEIVRLLSQIGSIQDERIYFRDGNNRSDILDDIMAAIAEVFQNGASCVFISELFDRYQEVLASQLRVFSQDVMRDVLLEASYGEYRAGRYYFYIRNGAPNADEDIRRFMRQSVLPMSYDAIHEKLWYIPLDTIRHCLVTTNELVKVAQETYFYAPNLPISAVETDQIAGLIRGRLGQKSFITDTELRELIQKNCPSVAINTESFSTWGLRNALAVLLGDRFSFRGAIISEHGQAINMAQAFAEFCRSHETMTTDELRDFSKEMGCYPAIYWESVYEVMTRISRNELVRREQVPFDVEATDRVIDALMDGAYMALKDFKLFLHFPAISVRWNEFVLESYAGNLLLLVN